MTPAVAPRSGDLTPARPPAEVVAHLALADVLGVLLALQVREPAYRVLPRVHTAADRLHDLCDRLAAQVPVHDPNRTEESRS